MSVLLRSFSEASASSTSQSSSSSGSIPSPTTDADNWDCYPIIVPKKAQDSRANLFILHTQDWPMVSIAGALNLRRHPSLTATKLLRWFGLLRTYYVGTPDERLSLKQVDIIPTDVFCYTISRDSLEKGSFLGPDSSETLVAGIYAVFTEDEDAYYWPLSPSLPNPTFQNIFLADYEGESQSPDEISQELSVAAAARDGGRCFFTGRVGDTCLCWIFQPSAIDGTTVFGYPPYDNYRVLENLITISKPLAAPFLTNKFSLDVDDNFRIVLFEDLPSDAPVLPVSLPLSARNTASAELWRRSFAYTLAYHLPVGETAEQDYPGYERAEWIEELFQRSWKSSRETMSRISTKPSLGQPMDEKFDESTRLASLDSL